MNESFNGELKKMQSILENDSDEFAVQPLLCALQAIRVLALVTEYPTQWILPFFFTFRTLRGVDCSFSAC